MSNSIPELPPIKKTHKLNLEKANDRILKNYFSCHDTGNSSIAYRVTEKSIENQNTDEIIKVLKSNTNGLSYIRKKELDLSKNNKSLLPKDYHIIQE